MTADTIDLVRTLRLNEATDDEALQSARDFALRCLRSKAPIPQTVMTVVERGAVIHTPAATTEATAATVPTKGESDE